MDDPISDEAARQRALDTYHIVDTLPEAAYDDIVRVASALCDAPVALLSLIDRDRQWFKASVGMDGTAMPRELAFCDHAIATPGRLTEVPDARQDPRFTGNPLVAGPPALRFYAGMPLVTPHGYAIGTVCVLDLRPRALSDVQRNALAALARLTMNLLDGRQRERELERAALLDGADAAAASALPPPELGLCTVAVYEVLGLQAWAQAVGERRVEKALVQMDEALHDCLSAGSGDVVNRVTGSSEFIAVLQGTDTGNAVHALHERLRALEREPGVQVLAGVASAVSTSEPLETVYQRAEQALSAAKDQLAADVAASRADGPVRPAGAGNADPEATTPGARL